MREPDELYCHECGVVLEPGVPVTMDAAGRLYCESEARFGPGAGGDDRVGWLDIGCGGTGEREGSHCLACEGTGVEVTAGTSEQDRQAWDEDEADMQRIADEWAAYDRDPPGS